MFRVMKIWLLLFCFCSGFSYAGLRNVDSNSPEFIQVISKVDAILKEVCPSGFKHKYSNQSAKINYEHFRFKDLFKFWSEYRTYIVDFTLFDLIEDFQEFRDDYFYESIFAEKIDFQLEVIRDIADHYRKARKIYRLYVDKIEGASYISSKEKELFLAVLGRLITFDDKTKGARRAFHFGDWQRQRYWRVWYQKHQYSQARREILHLFEGLQFQGIELLGEIMTASNCVPELKKPKKSVKFE